MIQTENKKISVRLMLISFIALIIGYLIKEPNDYIMLRFLKEENISIPLYLYDINFLGMTLPYKGTVITSVIFLGIGCYWYLYKTDQEIKLFFINLKENSLTKAKSKRALVIIISILITLTISIVYLASYFIELNSSTKPKSLGESLIIGFGKTFLGALIIAIVLGLFKNLTNKKR